MRSKISIKWLILFIFMIVTPSAVYYCQTESRNMNRNAIPAETQLLLAAAKPNQRSAINSVIQTVFLLRCRDRKGTSFLLKNGIVVSNEHVVKGCGATDLVAETPLGNTIKFTKVISDERRDLAILRPTERLDGGLDLATNDTPSVASQVSTWGYPLIAEGPAPLLTLGYVSGYKSSSGVKHFIVNGAFNPGNSGGPVLDNDSNKVVGVVVEKWTLFSRVAEDVINDLRASPTKTGSRRVIIDSSGRSRSVSNEELVAAVLLDFYEKVQVVIGEAISVSELHAFLKEKETELLR
jgi:hypothetical protein